MFFDRHLEMRSRAKANRPKQFVEVLGKPILAYTVDIYQLFPEIDGILVVCHRDWIKYCKKVVEDETLSKVRWIIERGKKLSAFRNEWNGST